jgi:hypothetical protein
LKNEIQLAREPDQPYTQPVGLISLARIAIASSPAPGYSKSAGPTAKNYIFL